MRKNILMFVLGIIVGSIGISTLHASRGSSADAWTENDVFRAIRLLEKIADNTSR